MPRPVRCELIHAGPEDTPGRPPILFVHGVAHAAWCWEHWQAGLAERGWRSAALSFRGHGTSDGTVRGATLQAYVRDVVAAAEGLGEPPVIVGHSMGGIVVQRALHRTPARAAALVAPAPAHSGVGFAIGFGRSHPWELAQVIAGRPVPFKRDDLVSREVTDADAADLLARLGPESALAQYQVTMPRRAPRPAPCPLLILATPDDAVIPQRQVERTGRLQGVPVHWFPGLGHDLMLEPRGNEPLDALADWLERIVVA